MSWTQGERYTVPTRKKWGRKSRWLYVSPKGELSVIKYIYIFINTVNSCDMQRKRFDRKTDFSSLSVVSDGLERRLRGWEHLDPSEDLGSFPNIHTIASQSMSRVCDALCGLPQAPGTQKMHNMRGGKHWYTEKETFALGFMQSSPFPQPLFRVLRGKLGLETNGDDCLPVIR